MSSRGNTRELITIISDLARNEDIRVCIEGSINRGAMAGIGALGGGLLLGKWGLPIGALCGGLTAAYGGNNFKPLAQIILENLSEDEKDLLISRVAAIVRDIVDLSNATQFAAILTSNQSIRNSVIGVVKDFARTDMNLSLQ